LSRSIITGSGQRSPMVSNWWSGAEKGQSVMLYLARK
jgi:hypothetical protein